MTISFAHDSPQLAQTYDRVSDLQLEVGKRLVERLELEVGARVLDVGCGTGRLARWIGERLGPKGSIVGIDPLEDRIRKIDAAKKYIVSSTLARVDWNAELVRGHLGNAVQQLKRESR